MLTLLLAAQGLAATLTVGPTGDYATMQDAANVASAGDTLQLAAGVYSDCLDATGLDLTISGAGAQSTFLYGVCANGTIYADTGTLTIEAVTLENRTGPSLRVLNSTTTLSFVEVFGGTGTLGAVSIVDGVTLIENSDISFNDGEAGAGIYAVQQVASDTSLTIRNSTFLENSATISGGAVATRGIQTVEITGSTFANNASFSTSGAVSVTGADSVFIGGSTFEDNVASRSAGAVSVSTSLSLTVDTSSFTQNIGGSLVGALWAHADQLHLSSVQFTQNTTDGHTGALHVEADYASLTDVLLDQNTSATHAGAAEMDVTELEIFDSTFSNNNTNGQGGALRLVTDNAVIEGTTFSMNRAGANGGIFHVNSEADI